MYTLYLFCKIHPQQCGILAWVTAQDTIMQSLPDHRLILICDEWIAVTFL